ncbi:hypothetical protein GC197_17015 [bacterium]|nr:hypothetical protein [bacterium]
MNRTQYHFATVVLVWAVSLLALTGCGASDGRHHVEGTITFQGEPVPRGVIRFTPDHQNGNIGPGAVATILDGHYETEAGRGVISGPHNVMIAGFDGVEVAEGAWEGQPLFAPYSTTWDFPDKSTVVDFEVPSKPAEKSR